MFFSESCQQAKLRGFVRDPSRFMRVVNSDPQLSGAADQNLQEGGFEGSSGTWCVKIGGYIYIYIYF